MATTSATARGASWKPRDFVALSLFWFPINMFWTAMLSTLLPSRVAQLVGDANKGTYFAIISAVGAVATTVIQLVIGPLSDACAARWGRRRPFIFWGTLLNTFALLAFAWADSFVGLITAFFCIQLFLNAANGPYQALLPDNVPAARHGLASAYMGASLLVGQLAGALSLLLLEPFGIRGVLLLIAPLLLIGMLVTVTRVPDAPAPPSERLPVGAALATLLDLRVREHPDFFGLLYSRFFINLSYSTVVAFLFYYLQDAIGPREQAEEHQMIVLLVATVAGLCGTVPAGILADRFSKKRILYAACLFLGLAALVFGFSRGFTMVLVLAFVFGAGWGAFAAVDWALACNLLPAGGAARYLAVWHMCMTVPQIIAPAFGRIADPLNRQFGAGFGWRVAMLSTVLYLLIGTLLLRRVRERPAVSP